MIGSVITMVDQSVVVNHSAVLKTGTRFDAGMYSARINQNGGLEINMEELTELHKPFESKENAIIIEAVGKFFKEGVRERINSLGFIHKLGILLYGKAGTSKTSVMHYLSDSMVKDYGAIVLFCEDYNSLKTSIGLSKEIRKIQENPIVFIADEFERYVGELESEMKNFLDGQGSVDNTLFLAATNYIDRVPETLKERPSRFRIVLEIKGIEDKRVMKDIFTGISGRIDPALFSEDEIDSIVVARDHMTIDEIKMECLEKATGFFVAPALSKPKIGFKKDETFYDGKVFTSTIDNWALKAAKIALYDGVRDVEEILSPNEDS